MKKDIKTTKRLKAFSFYEYPDNSGVWVRFCKKNFNIFPTKITQNPWPHDKPTWNNSFHNYEITDDILIKKIHNIFIIIKRVRFSYNKSEKILYCAENIDEVCNFLKISFKHSKRRGNTNFWWNKKSARNEDRIINKL